LEKEGFGWAVSQAKYADIKPWLGPADKARPNLYKRVFGYLIIEPNTPLYLQPFETTTLHNRGSILQGRRYLAEVGVAQGGH
jgi:hypothetical protein